MTDESIDNIKDIFSQELTSTSAVKKNSKPSFSIIAAVSIVVAGCVALLIQLFDAQSLSSIYSVADAPSSTQTSAPINLAQNVGMLLFVSILVAIVEEIIFRGILLGWLSKRLTDNAGAEKIHSIVVAIILTSAVFALFHALPIGDQSIAQQSFVPEPYLDAWTILSLALKFAQAFFFGVILAALRFLLPKTLSTQTQKDASVPWRFLLIAILLHALFDMLYFAVPVLTTGEFPQTYIITSPMLLSATCITTIIFALTAAAAFVRLQLRFMPNAREL